MPETRGFAGAPCDPAEIALFRQLTSASNTPDRQAGPGSAGAGAVYSSANAAGVEGRPLSKTRAGRLPGRRATVPGNGMPSGGGPDQIAVFVAQAHGGTVLRHDQLGAETAVLVDQAHQTSFAVLWGLKGLIQQQGFRTCSSLASLDTVLTPVSYTHLRAHETVLDLVCRLLLEKKKIDIQQ